ncbi:hypothetical protein [Sodalinema gerasimenkoae]|uniref:hypothetical protein n=1 Tax=Sodalinema gerasimenkoae TaxID=2862348 RepID=UPI00135B769E|nr:hypothetical protein [Sodalinema gerasimenkoae]
MWWKRLGNSPGTTWLLWGAIALVLFKLWAIAHLPIHASLAYHDNLRYIIRATQLLQGDVPYDGLVLARQPGYPAFIVASYYLGMPLRLSQELLYLAAGVFLGVSLQRWLKAPALTFLFLALYSLAPFSYHWNRQTLQEVIYLPLTAVFLGGCLNLLQDRHRPRVFLLHSLLIGLVLAIFWNTRPEGVWILPTLSLCYLYIAQEQGIFRSRPRFVHFAAGPLLSLAPVIFVTSALAWSNYLNYGLYHTYDLKTPGLTAAYSSLQRVSPGRQRPQIAVPEATRREIYAVSPSFRRLKPDLEISPDEGWRAASCGLDVCEDYVAGIFYWALRDAVDAQGFYESVADTEDFYWQIAQEVNGACERGWLDCQPQRRASFIPSLSRDLIQPWLMSTLRLGHQLTRSSLVLRLDSGLEDIELRERYYQQITREAADFFQARSQPLNQVKDVLIRGISHLYQVLFPICLGLGLLGWIWSFTHPSPKLLILAAILLLCILVRLLLVAYIDVTSWPVGAGDRYLRPLLPALWLLMVMGIQAGLQRWRHRQPPASEPVST